MGQLSTHRGVQVLRAPLSSAQDPQQILAAVGAEATVVVTRYLYFAVRYVANRERAVQQQWLLQSVSRKHGVK